MSTSYSSEQNNSWKFVLLLAIIAVVFSGLFDHDVWTPDEPRVAAIIHSMYITGDFIIPQFAGISFVEKPPVFFIISTVLMHATGLDAIMAGRLALSLLCLGSLAATYRIAYLFKGENFAWMALAVLGTLEGFILNFHWLRVDAALMFTTIAATWAFSEAYLRQKLGYLIVAGAFTGLAFLSKGPVAIVLCIGLAWVPLVLRALTLRKQFPEQATSTSQFVLMHVFGISVMCLVAASWIYPFYKTASPELWKAWFWDNQVGRLTGSATNTLGHNNAGKPFYYVKGILEYSAPWTPLLLLWLGNFIYKLRQPKQLSWTDGFFAFWFAIAIFVLSYSVTKRSMYLAPLMPLFALIIADALTSFSGKWFNWYRKGWLALMSLVLIAFAVVPLWSGFLPTRKIPPALMEWLSTWHLVALLPIAAIVLMVLVERKPWPQWSKMAIITALFFSSAFNYLFPAIDIAKDMKPDLKAFVEQVPVEKRDRIASVRFSETMTSIFFLYHNWAVPQVSVERAQAILDGVDPDYDYLLLDRSNSTTDIIKFTPFREDTQYKILAKGTPRSDKEKDAVFWLSGQ
ncbi:4-amino-4-deoxy-L-arabinose transferase and related glycosyltransferase of PMT family protein [Vibrio mediterranei AK1]|uniref:ArnT family glycosyltransferase n=1 Tax=Vibrio mediterranei TaxID=689 RepID=UPI00015406B2|nr:glycosyltransferase family 39 protein [Vibrio mediterranei]EDL55324.1 4-amino-4-deoxy-L-arabinose transferase and related glycosyltransferase of PMT family protein [Vibrio mediterranei AK1]